MKKLLVLAVFSLVVLLGSSAWAGTCPAIGWANDCNLVLTVNSNLTVSGATLDPNPYDGVEDQLVGVVNNSSITVTSLNLTGSNIFGFDGDGAGSPFCLSVGGAPNPCGVGPGPTGYEGPNTSFNIIDFNNGTVFFTNGGLAPGAIAWFSLEEPASANGVTGGGVNNPTPEPGSLILLGSGLVGVAGLVRRKKA